MRLVGVPEPPKDLFVPATVENWYSRKDRSWVVQLKDKYGNQVGHATYVATKKEAIDEENDMKKEYGI